jgi:anti-sigma-K factor RskA
MTVHDDAFSESVAALALGVLPEAEAREVAGHIRDCAACRNEYAELRSAADLVGFAAEFRPGELDEVSATRLKSRVMRAVRADAAVVPASAPDRAPRAASGGWSLYAAAAALVLAVLAAGSAVSLRNENAADRQRIAVLERQSALQSSALAQMVAPGAKHFPVASGEVIETNGHILLAFSHLAPAPAGKVYQAWTLARGATAVAPSITFAPDAAGNAVVELPQGAANLAAVAVSVEPPGGSKAPTSKPTFVRALS